jgi:tRNA (pseudouridine54-N1)-methyltransferase
VACLREFMLYSRLGRTESHWSNLHDAGRMDIVYECIVASLFLSHGLRRDVVFNAFLNGPPVPPLHLRINGEELFDVRTDLVTWDAILRKVVGGKKHPGVSVEKLGFEAVLKEKSETRRVYVLEEGGKDVSGIDFCEDPLFVLGDHVGLPDKAESFALRFGEKISLGKRPYLAASCITVLNYLLDVKERGRSCLAGV